ATAAGAGIINDVNGLRGEGALDAAAASGCAVAIMHMQGTPETMQQDPRYGFAPAEIYEFLEQRIADAVRAGIPRERIAIDPGFGFGKSPAHNLSLIGWTAMFHCQPVGRRGGGSAACRLAGSGDGGGGAGMPACPRS
ncbi:MAG: dihydropteroate synthase, partial [Alphaproteobacteria bacterium]